MRGRTGSRIIAPLMISLLVIAGFIGLLNFGSEVAKAPPTYISGTVYDGAGAPWTLAGSPYIVIDDVHVPAGKNLTIEPGVLVKVDGWHIISIDGNLSAIGTEANRIVITSNETSPFVGEYRGITVNSTGHADVRYCDILYGSDGLMLYSSSNVVLNTTISGSWYGLRLEGSSNTVVSYSNISRNRWIGLYLGWADNNTITFNNVSTNIGYGITGAASNTNISNNVVSDNIDDNGIDILGDNNTIANNTIFGINSDSGISTQGFDNVVVNNVVRKSNGCGIKVYRSSNTFVAHNNLVNNGGGFRIEESSNNTIINNNASENLNIGITIVDSTYNNITNNNISSSHTWGIVVYGSENNRIENNIIALSDWTGIRLGQGVSNNSFLRNNISLNTEGIQVSGTGASNNDFMHNNITSNSVGMIVGGYDNRIAFNNVSYNNNTGFSIAGRGVKYTLESNTIFENQVGIKIADASIPGPPLFTDHLVSNNTIFNNSVGIELSTISTGYIENGKIDYNTIYKNDIGINISAKIRNFLISKNLIEENRLGLQQYLGTFGENHIISNTLINNQDYAILLNSTAYTHIYHNNFINNGLLSQAIDDTDLNFWNDSYPSGGNYWSDYSPTCQDLYDGPVTPQTSGSPDGICDIQYDIDLDSADYYPLTTEYEELASPTNLSAELTGAFLENVTISWNASLEDPVNVTNYAVYYNTIYDGFGRDYRFLAEFPASGASRYYLTVTGIGEGDPNNYFFFVQANTSQVFRFSRSEHQAGKYTRDLTAGKHLVSIPLVLNNTNITSVLQTVKFDIAWYYDNSDPVDPWKSYNPSKLYNDLEFVDHTMGLWLVVNEECNLTVAGTVPKVTGIPLGAGWNLIGYPSFRARTVSEAFAGVSYQRIEGYSTMPPQYLQLLSPISVMTPGYGYWIKVPSPNVWVLIF